MTIDRKTTPQDNTAAQESCGNDEVLSIDDHADGVLTLSLRHNLVQGLAVIAFMGVGALIGFLTVKQRPDIAALIGAFLGMVVGTFLSGFLIMLLPPPKIRVTRRQIQRKYAQARKRLWITVTVALLLTISLPWIIGKFGHQQSNVAGLVFLGWPLATVAAWLYARGIALRLREWPCPRCGEPLGKLRKSCPQCDFLLLPSTDPNQAV